MNSLSELNRQEHPVRLRTHSQPRSHFPALAILLVAGVAIGCNSPVAPDNSIPDPALAALQLTGAALVVGGQVVNGQTMQAGQMQGTSTLPTAPRHSGTRSKSSTGPQASDPAA